MEGKEAGSVPGRERRLTGDLLPETLQARASTASPPAECLGRAQSPSFCAVPIAARLNCCELTGGAEPGPQTAKGSDTDDVS
jgi:hypothetical protein